MYSDGRRQTVANRPTAVTLSSLAVLGEWQASSGQR